MVGESPVVVVDAEIRGTNFAHPKLLLLVRRSRHRVSIFLLGQHFLLADFLNFLHEFHALLDGAFRAGFFRIGQLFADFLGELMHLFGLAGDFGRKLLLGFRESLLGQLGPPIAIVDETLEVFAGVDVVKVILLLGRELIIGPERQFVDLGALAQVHASRGENLMRATFNQERFADFLVLEGDAADSAAGRTYNNETPVKDHIRLNHVNGDSKAIFDR